MKKNARGFTLLEVLITLAILSTLTIFTAQAINQAIKAKMKVSDQMDEVSRMRDALRLIEGDINLAFHYLDVEIEYAEALKRKSQPAGQQGQQGQQGQLPNTGVPGGFAAPGVANNQNVMREAPRRNPETNFIGTEEAVNFVTSNNSRTVQNTAQADHMEVGYSVKDCRSLREGQGNSKCLWRRSSPYVDEDVTLGGNEVVLLENVSEFKLRYIGKGKQDWTSSWRTDAQGDAATTRKFPQAVEVSLTVEKPTGKGKSKKYSMQVVVPIHFPNNPEEAQNANAQTPSF